MQKQTTTAAVAAAASPLLSPTLSSTSSASSQQRLSDLLASFPQWNDPVLVQSLFAPLPSRSAKPEAFAQKFNFWHDVLLTAVRQRLLAGGSAFVIADTRGLGQKYFKNNGVGGLYPICLPGIFKEMLRNGTAVANLEDSELVRSGTSWLGRLVMGFLFSRRTEEGDDDEGIDDSDTAESQGSSTGRESELPQSLILLPLLNEQLQMLREHFGSTATSTLLPLTFNQFKSIVNTCRVREGLAEVSNQQDLLLLLRFLAKQRLLVFSQVDDVVKIIPATNHPGSSVEITQMDKDIVKIRGVADRLTEQITQYTNKSAQIRSSAAQKVSQSDRQGALLDLRRVAALDKFIKERMGALSNLDALLLKIEGAQDDVAVVEAYRSAGGLLKGLLKELEGAEEVKDDVAVLMGELEEKSAILSSAGANDKEEEEEMKELEAELASLLLTSQPVEEELAAAKLKAPPTAIKSPLSQHESATSRSEDEEAEEAQQLEAAA